MDDLANWRRKIGGFRPGGPKARWKWDPYGGVRKLDSKELLFACLCLLAVTMAAYDYLEGEGAAGCFRVLDDEVWRRKRGLSCPGDRLGSGLTLGGVWAVSALSAWGVHELYRRIRVLLGKDIEDNPGPQSKEPKEPSPTVPDTTLEPTRTEHLPDPSITASVAAVSTPRQTSQGEKGAAGAAGKQSTATVAGTSATDSGDAVGTASACSEKMSSSTAGTTGPAGLRDTDSPGVTISPNYQDEEAAGIADNLAGTMEEQTVEEASNTNPWVTVTYKSRASKKLNTDNDGTNSGTQTKRQSKKKSSKKRKNGSKKGVVEESVKVSDREKACGSSVKETRKGGKGGGCG